MCTGITFTLIIQPDVSANEQEDSGVEDSRGIAGWDKSGQALVSLKVHWIHQNVFSRFWICCESLTESFDYH